MKTRDYSHAFDETVDQPPHTNGDPNPECNGSGDPRGSWLADCILGDGKNPKPLPILANILIGIRAQWPEAIAYDEMACAAMLMKSLTGENGFTPRTLCDVDVGIIQKELQHLGLKRINKDATHQAVDIRASEHAFHPIRNYLDGLAWDSTERMGKLFINYFGAAAGPYVETVGRMFLISRRDRAATPEAARPSSHVQSAAKTPGASPTSRSGVTTAVSRW